MTLLERNLAALRGRANGKRDQVAIKNSKLLKFENMESILALCKY
jgi:hypothetical protein